MHGHYGPPIGSQPPRVEWSRDPMIAVFFS